MNLISPANDAPKLKHIEKRQSILPQPAPHAFPHYFCLAISFEEFCINFKIRFFDSTHTHCASHDYKDRWLWSVPKLRNITQDGWTPKLYVINFIFGKRYAINFNAILTMGWRVCRLLKALRNKILDVRALHEGGLKSGFVTLRSLGTLP